MVVATPDANELPRICFIHIPKTAGTSITSLLAELYKGCYFPGRTTEDYVCTSTDILRQHRLFAGHMYHRDWSRLPSDTAILTVLRDPVARCISLYKYWNLIDISHLEVDPNANSSLLEAVRLARTCSIIDFASSSNLTVIEHLRAAFATQFIAQHLVHDARSGAFNNADICKLVEQKLLSFSAVLTTERLSLSLQPALQHIGLKFLDLHLPQENVSHFEVEYDEKALRNTLTVLSPSDFSIYDIARQLETKVIQT